jgi:hypothetical protein
MVTVLICHGPRGAMSEGLPILPPSLEKRPDKTFIARIERLRLSRLPFQFDGCEGDRPDDCELHRESISAL